MESRNEIFFYRKQCVSRRVCTFIPNSIPLFTFTVLFTFVETSYLMLSGDVYGFSYLKESKDFILGGAGSMNAPSVLQGTLAASQCTLIPRGFPRRNMIDFSTLLLRLNISCIKRGPSHNGDTGIKHQLRIILMLIYITSQLFH